HVHAFTRAVSILLVRAAKQRGLPVIFTYHTPTASCQRGTLLLRGKEVCDGVLSVRRCTSCSLEGYGMAGMAADLLSLVPVPLSHFVGTLGSNGRVWTALRMPELIHARHAVTRAFFQEVDSIVALKEWVRALLLRNGIPSRKIIVSEHGLRNGM